MVRRRNVPFPDSGIGVFFHSLHDGIEFPMPSVGLPEAEVLGFGLGPHEVVAENHRFDPLIAGLAHSGIARRCPDHEIAAAETIIQESKDPHAGGIQFEPIFVTLQLENTARAERCGKGLRSPQQEHGRLSAPGRFETEPGGIPDDPAVPVRRHGGERQVQRPAFGLPGGGRQRECEIVVVVSGPADRRVSRNRGRRRARDRERKEGQQQRRECPRGPEKAGIMGLGPFEPGSPRASPWQPTKIHQETSRVCTLPQRVCGRAPARFWVRYCPKASRPQPADLARAWPQRGREPDCRRPPLVATGFYPWVRPGKGPNGSAGGASGPSEGDGPARDGPKGKYDAKKRVPARSYCGRRARRFGIRPARKTLFPGKSGAGHGMLAVRGAPRFFWLCSKSPWFAGSEKSPERSPGQSLRGRVDAPSASAYSRLHCVSSFVCARRGIHQGSGRTAPGVRSAVGAPEIEPANQKDSKSRSAESCLRNDGSEPWMKPVMAV